MRMRLARPRFAERGRTAGLSALFLLASALLAAAAPAKAEIVATDVTGRTIRLEAPAHRILIDDGRYFLDLAMLCDDPVSLVVAWPHDSNRLGEEIYARFRQRFPQIETLKHTASSSRTLSVEQVLAAEPDLAVFSLMSKPSAREIELIEAAGIPVAIADNVADPLENVDKTLLMLGTLTGNEARAKAAVAFRQERYRAIAERLASRPDAGRPKVFLEAHASTSTDCCNSPGTGSIGAMIDFAGGHNIGADVIDRAFGKISLEYVIEAKPEIYIATGGAYMEKRAGVLVGPDYDPERTAETLAKVLARTGFSELPAVTAGNVHALSHQLFSSPLDVLTIELLAKWIHPDLFSDIDVAKTRDAMNARLLSVPLEGVYWSE